LDSDVPEEEPVKPKRPNRFKKRPLKYKPINRRTRSSFMKPRDPPKDPKDSSDDSKVDDLPPKKPFEKDPVRKPKHRRSRSTLPRFTPRKRFYPRRSSVKPP